MIICHLNITEMVIFPVYQSFSPIFPVINKNTKQIKFISPIQQLDNIFCQKVAIKFLIKIWFVIDKMSTDRQHINKNTYC